MRGLLILNGKGPRLLLVNSVQKSHHMVVVWWCCGGGVVFLSDYRTTPVNIVQLCTGLGCGNYHRVNLIVLKMKSNCSFLGKYKIQVLISVFNFIEFVGHEDPN